MTIEFVHNAIPDPVDERDYVFRATFNTLPPKVDLRCHAGGIEDQKTTGSCVANATVSALELLLERKQKFFDLSRLFLYYNLRAPYSDLRGVDRGCFLRDGFKSVSNQGICSENTWDFIVSKTNTKPDTKSYTEAAQHKVQRYERISGFTLVTSTKTALAEGYPVTITLLLGGTFYGICGDIHTHDYKGVDNDKIGAHAMNIVGYDDGLGGFIVENSWGITWGDSGYFLLKYDVMKKDCADAWVCTAFDGLVFDDMWEDDSPDIKLRNGTHTTLTNYKEDGRTFEGNMEVISGVMPYKFNWRLFNMYGNAGSYIVHGDRSSITYILKPNASIGAVVCEVEGSGPLEKSITAFITFKYVDTPNPNPKPEPEPDPPKPEPDPPKPKPKDEKWWYVIKRFFDFVSNIIEKIKDIF